MEHTAVVRTQSNHDLQLTKTEAFIQDLRDYITVITVKKN